MSLLCFRTGQNSRIPICVDNDSVERPFKEAAQKALKAIGSKRILSASYKKANRGQHVFNNGLLGFHRSVLQDLLRDLGGYDEQLENLVQDLMIPLNQTVQNAISTMVAHFSSNEFYVDYNADVFGEFVRELRNALVTYIKADTSVSEGERYGIQMKFKRVQIIATQMANHEVYVDPMACNRWRQENQRAEDVQLFNQVRGALKIMFQNILQDFQKVSDKIRVFRRRKSWSWDQTLEVILD
ncbi:uncharacterized protein [Sinocyclocheilus grahami]|uniref:uncharacterized protein n=1 Tax=Sinocyclocheilus grahami TaxID=75366 RepID=UPI0007ACF3E8|nr:PREDICTED: uncharacterized protein LOC107572249 [Sinocyclocheilus grahami]